MLHGSRTNNALRTSRNAPWRSGCSQTLSRSVGRPNTFRPSQTLSGPMPGASWPAGSPLPPRPPPPAPAPEAAMGMLGSTCRVGAAACAVLSRGLVLCAMESGFVKDFGTSAPKHSAWRNAASAAASPDTLRKHRRSSTASTSRAAPEPVEQDACSPSKSPAPPVPPVPVDLGVCRPSSSVHMSSATCALSLATKTTPPAGSASYKSSASCEVSTGTIHSQCSQPVEGWREGFPQGFAGGHARTCRVRVRPRSSRRLGGYGSGKHTLATRKVGASVASNARR